MSVSADHATKLQAWRAEHGYTTVESADLAGCSPAMWSKAERGLRQFSPATKVVIARRLGVRVSVLFDVDPLEEAAS